MKTTIFLLLLPTLLCAQNGLEGLWEGTITQGDLTRTDGHRFELYLTVENGVIEGVSTIYVSQDSIIKQKLRGRMYQDRSVGLQEVDEGQYKEAARKRDMPESAFFRKYQFIFNRSLYESSLNGYWQEVTPTPLSVERKKGRIFLKRKSSKA
jgi:hypothetical protein